MATIFDFLDYRVFLKAVYQERKEKYRFFSHRWFLKQAGITNSGFLKLIMDGKRSLTPDMTIRFGRALALSSHELDYFTNLVVFNQAKTSGEKEKAYRELKTISSKVRRKIIGADLFDYYEHWYVPVIRELVCLHDFKDDFRAMAGTISPAIKPGEARRAVQFLLAKKMLLRREDGTYEQSDPFIDTSDEVASIVVRNFNRKMIALAGEALDRYPRNERYARGFTLGISLKTYDAILAEMKNFNDRVAQLVVDDTTADKVYQLNLQLFPLASRPGGAA